MSLIQREGRPALDLEPGNTPASASWDEHYDNVGMNPLNHPVKERKGNEPPNGWMSERYDTTQTEDV